MIIDYFLLIISNILFNHQLSLINNQLIKWNELFIEL